MTFYFKGLTQSFKKIYIYIKYTVYKIYCIKYIYIYMSHFLISKGEFDWFWSFLTTLKTCTWITMCVTTYSISIYTHTDVWHHSSSSNIRSTMKLLRRWILFLVSDIKPLLQQLVVWLKQKNSDASVDQTIIHTLSFFDLLFLRRNTAVFIIYKHIHIYIHRDQLLKFIFFTFFFDFY